MIDHGIAISIEGTVRKAYYHCERFAFFGLINSDRFERDPFSAAYLVLSPLYHSGERENDIKEFIEKYSLAFVYPEEGKDINVTAQEFDDELHALVKKYYVD